MVTNVLLLPARAGSVHAAKHFLSVSEPFEDDPTDRAVLEIDKRWMHMDPMALAMCAAWGAWCKGSGLPVEVENDGKQALYAVRMGLYKHLGVNHTHRFEEHEHSGRFVPITQVRDQAGLKAVIADISTTLHMHSEPDALAAVQYCVSELSRNVLEHSGSPEGAFVCAQSYWKGPFPRVTIAVADCGAGITEHLGAVRGEVVGHDDLAIQLAMQPGVTGARPGPYGTPENAGAGLFITRSIAKGTGGYFFVHSGSGAFRLRRNRSSRHQIQLFHDPYREPRHDKWKVVPGWTGTVVALEIGVAQIEDFQGFFQWIRSRMPSRIGPQKRARFT